MESTLRLVLSESQKLNLAKHCVLPIVQSRWGMKTMGYSLLRNTNELQDFISDLHSYPVVLNIPWFHNHYKWGIILKKTSFLMIPVLVLKTENKVIYNKSNLNCKTFFEEFLVYWSQMSFTYHACSRKSSGKGENLNRKDITPFSSFFPSIYESMKAQIGKSPKILQHFNKPSDVSFFPGHEAFNTCHF